MEERSLLQVAIDQMSEGIQVVDREWRYVYLNAAAARHARVEASALLGRTMAECYPGIDQSPLWRDLTYVMKGGEARHIENEFSYADGTKCWFELTIESHAHGLLIRSLDITRRKQLQEQLRHAHRLETISHLAASVAHDFNNKLGIILVYGQMLEESYPSGATEDREYVRQIISATRESAALVRKLMGLGRQQVLSREPIDLRDFAEELRPNLTALLGPKFSLELKSGPGELRIIADRSELEQCILNLCMNSRDAMPSGGRIIVDVRRTQLDDDYARRHPNVVPGDFVLIEVSDNGPGMDRDTLARIFEPFYTTKTTGKGSGLGLAIVQGFVQQCNGHVWAYSEPGLGATFKIYLPVAGVVEAPDPEAAIQSESDLPLAEGILLVDDDQVLREGLARSLKRKGYRVHTAASVAEAEMQLLRNGNQIQLLLSDIAIGAESGIALAARLSARKPELRVVFISGQSEDLLTERPEGDFILIRKPAMIVDVLQTLRQVLDGQLRDGVI